jgi:hypothetical protein
MYAYFGNMSSDGWTLVVYCHYHRPSLVGAFPYSSHLFHSHWFFDRSPSLLGLIETGGDNTPNYFLYNGRPGIFPDPINATAASEDLYLNYMQATSVSQVHL